MRKTYEAPLYIYIVWLALATAVGLGLYWQDWATAFVSLLTLGTTIYVVFAKNKIYFGFPPIFFTSILVFIYATLFLGEAYDYYERFWWWDIFLHTGYAIGFGLLGASILIIMFQQNKIKASPFVTGVFAGSFAIAGGVVWEIFEFSMDQLFGFNMQKTGLIDTMGDLIVNTIGALIGAGAGYMYLKGYKSNKFTFFINEFIKTHKRRNKERFESSVARAFFKKFTNKDQ